MMTRRTHRILIPLVTAITLSVLGTGCSHQASTDSDSLAQQKAGVMGSPAPPAVRAQIDAQLAAQQAARQAGQQAGQQAARQADAQRAAPK